MTYPPWAWSAALVLCGCSMTSVTIADDRLYEVLKDAQTTNAAAFPRGRMNFRVMDQAHPPDRGLPPIRVEGSVVWENDKAFWTYRISDPEKRVTGTWDRKGPVDQVRTEYLLIADGVSYWYNAYYNCLFIHPFRDPHDGGALFYLLAVLPQWHWYRCCPPFHTPGGRAWVDMIGPQSPAMPSGSKMEIEQLPDGRIVQTRDDGESGVGKYVFSLDYGGNVVEMEYKSFSPRSHGRAGEYHWRKLPDGRCVLESCEFRSLAPGKPEEVDGVYTLEITSFTDQFEASTAPLTFNALKGFLPRNTMVDDHVTMKDYPLFPGRQGRESPRPGFDVFSRELQSRGFLKR